MGLFIIKWITMEQTFQSFQPTILEPGLRRAGLLLESTTPSEVLRNIVHSYLQIRAEASTPYPVMPDGTQSIFFSIEGAMIGGAQSQLRNIPILSAGDYFGIRFYPGALRHFFNLQLIDITDQYVDDHYFSCQEFSRLSDRLYDSETFLERTNLCEQWLLQRYHPQSLPQLDHALHLIYQTFGNIKINQLAEYVGWSHRHLNRLFLQHTGLNTKTFCNIIRIQHASRQLYLSPKSSLSPMFELGFFDQSHLIKEFRKYLLASPGEFLSHLNAR